MSVPARPVSDRAQPRSCHWCKTGDGRLLRYGLTPLWICSDLAGCARRQAAPGTAGDRPGADPGARLRLLPVRGAGDTPELSDVI